MSFKCCIHDSIPISKYNAIVMHIILHAFFSENKEGRFLFDTCLSYFETFNIDFVYTNLIFVFRTRDILILSISNT